ncbi:nonribosomal peptide synthase [Aspergillus luchuensis]|uniref:Nonribosomal peptide synthase n=1 Tax=Aspergillus kawachii TaxID=1069201 RepID=A0A146F1G6_ASPKA|nr:hypothetical protein ALUC_11680S [Aspergillus luchuensis]GAT19789.1 nonribosomal peptide synthase [Aspergillus luchuensis]
MSRHRKMDHTVRNHGHQQSSNQDGWNQCCHSFLSDLPANITTPAVSAPRDQRHSKDLPIGGPRLASGPILSPSYSGLPSFKGLHWQGSRKKQTDDRRFVGPPIYD